MKIAYDFHIHSGLSPCSDKEMTPNNIINMAIIKGLDAIAITDHNSTINLEAFIRAGYNKDIIIIPGAEVTTKEEAHVLTLFSGLDEANKFQRIMEAGLPTKKNKAEFFGQQLIYCQDDNIVGEYQWMLSNALSLSMEDLVKVVDDLKGVSIPAHVNRPSFSILTNLGFISPELGLSTIEVTKGCSIEAFKEKNPSLKNYRILVNSDAHSLGDIQERESFLEVPSLDARAIIDVLRRKDL